MKRQIVQYDELNYSLANVNLLAIILQRNTKLKVIASKQRYSRQLKH